VVCVQLLNGKVPAWWIMTHWDRLPRLPNASLQMEMCQVTQKWDFRQVLGEDHITSVRAQYRRSVLCQSAEMDERQGSDEDSGLKRKSPPANLPRHAPPQLGR
jgi:hypothetical protein